MAASRPVRSGALFAYVPLYCSILLLRPRAHAAPELLASEDPRRYTTGNYVKSFTNPRSAAARADLESSHEQHNRFCIVDRGAPRRAHGGPGPDGSVRQGAGAGAA